jgi:hypothetical protein
MAAKGNCPKGREWTRHVSAGPGLVYSNCDYAIRLIEHDVLLTSVSFVVVKLLVPRLGSKKTCFQKRDSGKKQCALNSGISD